MNLINFDERNLELIDRARAYPLARRSLRGQYREMEFSLSVPYMRMDSFNPLFLSIIRSEEDESGRFFSALYRKGLILENIG